MEPITNNKAFISAYNKGGKARSCGMNLDMNPYPDKRNSKGGPTFSRAFRRFWTEGWDDGKPEGFEVLAK